MWVGCFRRATDVPYDEPAREFAEVVVMDARRLWIDPDLDCPEQPGGRFASGEAIGTVPDDVDGLVRSQVPGLQADDHLIKPGYPDTQFHGEPRLVVRDGEPVAGVTIYQQRSRWVISVRRCRGVAVGS
jgi:hypothetical protein